MPTEFDLKPGEEPPEINPIKALRLNRPKRKNANALVFSDRERRAVSEMVALGFTRPQVAKVLGISESAMDDHFDEELFIGRMEKIASVSQTMFAVATNINHKNVVPAGMYILKTQGGAQWRDVVRSELTGADGKPIAVESTRTIDPRLLTGEQREAMRGIIESAMRLVGPAGSMPSGQIIEGDFTEVEDLV